MRGPDSNNCQWFLRHATGASVVREIIASVVREGCNWCAKTKFFMATFWSVSFVLLLLHKAFVSQAQIPVLSFLLELL